MRPFHRVAPGRILDDGGDPIATLFDANGSCSDVHRNALGLQNLVHGVRNLRILATDQSRPSLDHRHLTAEPPIHLRKFKTDVAPTYNYQTLMTAPVIAERVQAATGSSYVDGTEYHPSGGERLLSTASDYIRFSLMLWVTEK